MNDTKQTIVDVVDASTTYYGETKLGRATSQNTWTIRRVSTVGGVSTTYYPRGTNGRVSDAPLFIWDNRATLDYALSHDSVTVTIDTEAPTVTTYPSWGTGVDSNVTVNKSITFSDNVAGTPDSVTIDTQEIGTISNLVIGAFDAATTFSYTAPVNPGPGPITVTFTYTVTDASGNIGTFSEDVDIAEAL